MTGRLPSISVNFPCGRDTFHQFLSTFNAAERSSVNFREFSMHPGDETGTYVNFPGRLCQFLSTFHTAERLRQLPSTIHAARKPSVNFHQLFVLMVDLPSISVNFPAGWETFRQILLTFRVNRRPPINFCQLFMHLRNVLKIFVNIQCIRKTFCELLSTFHATRRPSVKFCQLSVWSDDLPSTNCAAGRSSINFCQLFVPPGDLSISVNYPCSR